MLCGKEDKINCQNLKYKQNYYSMRKGAHIQTQKSIISFVFVSSSM